MQPSSEPETHPHDPIHRIVLATDLGADSPYVFAHGLKLALRSRAELFLLHISDEDHPEATWRRLPTVRALLERWGILPVDATHTDFEALGIKVHALDKIPVDGDLRLATAARIAQLKPDLLIMGTHARTGFDRLLHSSVAEPVVRDVHKATLLVPSQARGLVDPESGELALKRVLVPITNAVPQQPLIDQLTRLLYSLEVGPVQFTMVHVGREDTIPSPSLPARSDWMWRTDLRRGAVVEQILEAEVEHEVDLIAMATHGHDSVMDAILGSNMERVVRRAGCPVFAVPV